MNLDCVRTQLLQHGYALIPGFLTEHQLEALRLVRLPAQLVELTVAPHVGKEALGASAATHLLGGATS